MPLLLLLLDDSCMLELDDVPEEDSTLEDPTDEEPGTTDVAGMELDEAKEDVVLPP